MATRLGNKRMGAKLQDYRKDAGLTADDLARASGVKRSYITAIEVGRMNIMYPETFVDLKRVLRFPGWDMLEAMGYPTDAGDDDIYPRLLHVARQLPMDQQEALAKIGTTLLRASPDSDEPSVA